LGNSTGLAVLAVLGWAAVAAAAFIKNLGLSSDKAKEWRHFKAFFTSVFGYFWRKACLSS
jgi:hypothetical protein